MKEKKYNSIKDKSILRNMDLNQDGVISEEELAKAEELLEFEYKLAMQENHDKREDAQRNMAWFALFGMLLYPFSVLLSSWIGLSEASKILGDMAPTYFVSVAAIVAAFYGKEAYIKTKENSKI